MLRFTNEVPTYNAGLERFRFVGLDQGREVICRVSKDALLALADETEDSITAMLATFAENRRLLEDIASVEHAAGSRDTIMIERFHIEHPLFKAYRAQPAAPAVHAMAAE